MMKLVSTSKEQATASEILFANSSLCVAFLLVYGVLSGEFYEAMQFPELGTLSFMASLGASSFMGASLGFGQLLCTRANSPLTTTMVGQMKAVFSTIAGAMMFGTALQALQVAGIVLNTMGALLIPSRFHFSRKKPLATSLILRPALRGFRFRLEQAT